MSEHPPTSINIEYDRQDYYSKLTSRTESHISTVVTRHKKIRLFYHQVKKLLFRIFQKYHPIKKITPKIINLLKILKNIFNNLKHTKVRITQIIMLKLLSIHKKIILPNIMSQAQVKMKMLLIKTQDIKAKTGKYF